MKLKAIKSKKQYQKCLDWIDEQFDRKVKKNSPKGEQLEIVLLLVKRYEDQHYPIPVR